MSVPITSKEAKQSLLLFLNNTLAACCENDPDIPLYSWFRDNIEFSEHVLITVPGPDAMDSTRLDVSDLPGPNVNTLYTMFAGGTLAALLAVRFEELQRFVNEKQITAWIPKEVRVTNMVLFMFEYVDENWHLPITGNGIKLPIQVSDNEGNWFKQCEPEAGYFTIGEYPKTELGEKLIRRTTGKKDRELSQILNDLFNDYSSITDFVMIQALLSVPNVCVKSDGYVLYTTKPRMS